MKELFECKAWVCVSENFDGLKIKRHVLKQLIDPKKCDNLTPEQMDVRLKASLMLKRCLFWMICGIRVMLIGSNY